LDGLRPSLILIVDDVPLNRELMLGYFEGTRHRLLCAGSGVEGIEMTKKYRPDILLMDMRLPDMDGYAARKAIHETPELKTIPMIAVTASSSLAEEESLRKVFEGHLRKPLTRASLYTELTRLLPEEREKQIDAPRAIEPLLISPVAQPARWRELAGHLRALEAGTWRILSKSMGLRETEAFALDLVNAAKSAGCGPLANYAGKLLAEVQAIDIQGQEETMKAFPEVVGEIDRLARGAMS
jgi:CheY-like chemotaxis protein